MGSGGCSWQWSQGIRSAGSIPSLPVVCESEVELLPIDHTAFSLREGISLSKCSSGLVPGAKNGRIPFVLHAPEPASRFWSSSLSLVERRTRLRRRRSAWAAPPSRPLVLPMGISSTEDDLRLEKGAPAGYGKQENGAPARDGKQEQEARPLSSARKEITGDKFERLASGRGSGQQFVAFEERLHQASVLQGPGSHTGGEHSSTTGEDGSVSATPPPIRDENEDEGRPDAKDGGVDHRLCSSKDRPTRAEEEDWSVWNGDTATLAPDLPFSARFSPRALAEFLTAKLQMLSPSRLYQSLSFWKPWRHQEEEEGGPSLGSAAFEKRMGVSRLHQWAAMELTLQHAQLRRIARDILWVALAFSLVGLVRVLEAMAGAFCTSPPCYSKLLEAANASDAFMIASLAHRLRRPILGILAVDPINLEEVARLKARIWEEMHRFYERQWKVVATLAMARLLSLIATALPSAGSVTKNAKICWDMLLALPIF